MWIKFEMLICRIKEFTNYSMQKERDPVIGLASISFLNLFFHFDENSSTNQMTSIFLSHIILIFLCIVLNEDNNAAQKVKNCNFISLVFSLYVFVLLGLWM